MPSIRVGKYRIGFVEFDLNERPHVHVWHANNEAKFWIDRIEFFSNRGFPHHELNKIERILQDKQAELLALWNQEMGKR